MQYPVLYSFRRCPYAIRARMALAYAGVECELREVVLKDKPQAMLEVSAKGTVPVLILDGKVIDESIEVMDWALQQSDPDNWSRETLKHDLVRQNDNEFKHWLDRYKYADRYPEGSLQMYRDKALEYLTVLESSLVKTSAHEFYLESPQISAIDMAIFPFVRQFAFVDRMVFEQLPLPRLQRWLDAILATSLFASIMVKYPQWRPDDPKTLVFGAETREASLSRL